MKRSFIAVLLLAPQLAWAHGDHGRPDAIYHLLTSPEHLGVVLLVGAVLALLGKRWQRGTGPRSKRARNDTA